MVMMISFIIAIFLISIFILLVYKDIKNSETFVEKIVYVIYALIVIVITLIYVLDRYNIPTEFKLASNVDTQNWLEVLGNYCTGIISSIIAALVAVWTTLHQIQKNNEDNDKRDAKNLRIQNMPILKFSLNTDEDISMDMEYVIKTGIEGGNTYKLIAKLKNVGLNIIKNMKVDFEIDAFNTIKERVIGGNSIVVLDKGEELVIGMYLPLKASEELYKIRIIVYYEDVLNNWYKQVVSSDYKVTNVSNGIGCIGLIEYSVGEEEFIERKCFVDLITRENIN